MIVDSRWTGGRIPLILMDMLGNRAEGRRPRWALTRRRFLDYGIIASACCRPR
ncbi:hypothetical protein FRACA_2550004 [Frankia canadensis]|uniref:Uncharacterized protein n=1 Tax=Frankia canadensis TaxID=1836972 RepID=A0A2I2KS78_9ACTN|nr:hypothetical protein FRACA_2550004 [Frankia canadensis]SOU55811.1 hypothetical protein FRACA_2550004 [Frankia canadensis]